MVWLVLFLICAGINWASVEFRWRWGEILSKPAALMLLILFFWQVVGWDNGKIWFGLGLVFSLAGDTFLLWTKRLFIPGLLSFLTAHVCYVIGLNQDPIQIETWVWVAVVIIAGMGFSCYRVIRRGMVQKPENAGLRLPILGYCLVISLMLLSAWVCLFRPQWPTPAGWMVAAGASLFMVSDFLLAYGMFVRRIQRGDLLVMVTYHLAQAAIVVGVMLRYTG